MARWNGLTEPELEAVVEDALASLPPRFAKAVKNVVIAIEDEPNADDLASLEEEDGEAHADDEILGIYRGVALTDRAFDDAPLLPDEIAIFRGPINRVVGSREEAIREVRETVIHELGHYFGLGDHEMHY